MESKPDQYHTGGRFRPYIGGIIRIFPVPRTLGSFIILVTVLAFIAGKFRNELALTLLGTVLLISLVYCFFGVFFLGIIQRRKARLLSMVIVSETVSTGKEGELLIKTSSGEPLKKNYFWRFPAILIRCELCLETNDGRVIRHYADPGIEKYSRFPVRERGAYYGVYERLVVFDAPGFFRLSLPVENSGPEQSSGPMRRVLQNKTPRLLAFPSPAEDPVHLSIKSGGTERRNEVHYRKSDDLTDHRPYVPGDDPRRINWKLYSHVPLGELFVREGEPEPPPHSRLLILIDTETDRSLYTADEARLAVDMLCEIALAAALEFFSQGMEILIGYTGGEAYISDEVSSGPGGLSGGQRTGGRLIGGKAESGPLNAAELASALAWPAAISEWNRAVLPNAPEDRTVLILALPRSTAEPSALDRFLKNRDARQNVDIVFLYSAENQRTGGRQSAELENSARISVNLYNGRSGVHAEKIAVSPARERKNR